MRRPVFLDAVLILLVGMSTVACYQPVELLPDKDSRVPCLYCILNEADTQFLSLHYLPRTISAQKEAIDGAEIVLEAWSSVSGDYQKRGNFLYSGEGVYYLVTPDGINNCDSTWRLKVLLPNGDKLTAITHAAHMETKECFMKQAEPASTEIHLHDKVYHYTLQTPVEGQYQDPSRLFFCINTRCPVWIHKVGWSADLSQWYPEDELTTNLENRVDPFNKLLADFNVSTVPEALSCYPSVIGKPLHYRYLRFPAGSLSPTDTIAISGDFSGVHYGVLGSYLEAIRDFHRAAIDYSEIAGLSHNEAECAWLFDDRAGYIQIKAVSDEYDHYLKDVANYELSTDVSSDIICIYNNTNTYTNIHGGTGIFGAEVNSKLYWSCGIWIY